MTTKLPTTATTTLEKTFADRIGVLFEKLKTDGQKVADSFVRQANDAREIGILLKEWSGHEQINFDFFKSREKSLPFTFEAAKIFVSIANRMPAPAENLLDARKVMQLSFESTGLLQIPTRSEAQSASGIAPVLLFGNALGAAKERLEKWLISEPIETWSRQCIEMTRGELRWAVDLDLLLAKKLARK